MGVSRTSKTPLSIYLGYLGHKTANVPIVKGIEPPQELFEIEPAEDRRADDRGVAARGHPPGARAARWAAQTASTPSSSEIYEELEEATAVQRRLGCPVLEVSELSIEETAHRIIRLVEQRRAESRGGDP